MSKKPTKFEFYGINGYCFECHQPLEGSCCPYCGWEDKGPPQCEYGKIVETGEALTNLTLELLGKEYARVIDERGILEKKLEIAIKAMESCKRQPLNAKIIIDNAFVEIENVK